MKKLINLVALVMLVSVNIVTPFSYADVEDFVDNVENIENEVENSEGEEEDLVNDNELLQLQDLNLMKSAIYDSIQILREGEVISTYTGLSQAINEAESGDVISLIDDISVSEVSVISGKSLTINGNNHTITRDADITTITVNEDSTLILQDIVITDDAVNFTPNRYDSLLRAQSSIPLCLGGVLETRNESGDVISSVCDTENVDVAKTHPQIYSVGDIYGDNLTISNSLSSQGSAAIIVEKGGIEMVNSNFIHNGASGAGNGGRGGAMRVGPNTATDIVDESPVIKILFSGCYFENNYANTNGGALSLQYTPEIISINNCIFSGNTARSNGGAIHIPNIWSNPGGYLPSLPDGSLFPAGTLYIDNTNFYSNRCGNDGSAIGNDDLFLEVNSSNFEHNYGTQPGSTSVGVISCQVGGANRRSGRGLIWREFKIKNSSFRDSSTVVLGDHGRVGSFSVDGCVFEDVKYVLLSYHGRGEIKNSTIKNSFHNCGKEGYNLYDFQLNPDNGYSDIISYFGESLFKLENNTYSNDCITNPYFPVTNFNGTTGILNLEIYDGARLMVNRRYYDSVNVQGTDEIYYGATIDDGKFAYLKKNRSYNFDEYNNELSNFSNGYQLGSGKTMLFYLDNGYIELWSGSISTTTNLYGKETDVYNIKYEGMDGVDFEGITHTYKFNNLNHTQYLTELTPYTLNEPSRDGYKFEGRFLDTGYVVPVTSIGTGSTGDVILYAKWKCADGYENKGGTCVKKSSGSSGGGGGGRPTKSDTSKEDNTQTETMEQFTQDENDIQQSTSSSDDSSDKGKTTTSQGGKNSEAKGGGTQSYSTEFQQAYEFAHENGIITKSTIESAKMNGKLTRIQMAKMLSNYAMNVLGQEPDVSKGVIKFKDVSDKRDADYDNGVTLAYQLGIMGQNMKDDKFRPDDEVTRGEFVTALSRLLYSTSDGEYKSTSKYYIHHMEKLKEEGIITKTDPKMKELRGYVMIMLMRSAK